MIRALTDLDADDRTAALQQIEAIFFLSSASGGTMLGPARDAFYRRWTHYYIEHHPDLVLLAETDGAAIGYLMGCDRSADAQPLYRDLFYYQAFEYCYAAYPAHLHVNIHPDHRSGGVGASLVETFESLCAARRCTGVHLVTAAGARNRAFYERLGYELVSARRVEGRELVLLGHKISSKDK